MKTVLQRNLAAPQLAQTTSPMRTVAGAASLVQSANPSSAIKEGRDVDYRSFQFQELEAASVVCFDKYVGPTPESNWVVPGKLLVGAYPASIDDKETLDLITSILQWGVTKFVCLQQEYREHGVTEAMWRSGQALRPYFEDVRSIVRKKHMLACLHNYPVVDEANLSFVHFPIRDCGITDDDRVLELARSLVKSIAEGEIIYLHCWGGHGRTGTLVCIMLHLMYGHAHVQAMEYCQAVHDLRQCPVVVGSPQTQSQRDQVTRVIQKLMTQSRYRSRTLSGDGNMLSDSQEAAAPSSPVSSGEKTLESTLVSPRAAQHVGSPGVGIATPGVDSSAPTDAVLRVLITSNAEEQFQGQITPSETLTPPPEPEQIAEHSEGSVMIPMTMPTPAQIRGDIAIGSPGLPRCLTNQLPCMDSMVAAPTFADMSFVRQTVQSVPEANDAEISEGDDCRMRMDSFSGAEGLNGRDLELLQADFADAGADTGLQQYDADMGDEESGEEVRVPEIAAVAMQPHLYQSTAIGVHPPESGKPSFSFARKGLANGGVGSAGGY